jgi:hypothetical protein
MDKKWAKWIAVGTVVWAAWTYPRRVRYYYQELNGETTLGYFNPLFPIRSCGYLHRKDVAEIAKIEAMMKVEIDQIYDQRNSFWRLFYKE